MEGLLLPPSAATKQLMARIGAFSHVILGELDGPQYAVSWVDIDASRQGQETAKLLFEHMTRKTQPRQILLSPTLLVRPSSSRFMHGEEKNERTGDKASVAGD